MKRTLVYSVRAEPRKQNPAFQPQLGMYTLSHSRFSPLSLSAKDHGTTVNTDIGVTINFSEEANVQIWSVNEEDSLY